MQNRQGAGVPFEALLIPLLGLLLACLDRYRRRKAAEWLYGFLR